MQLVPEEEGSKERLGTDLTSTSTRNVQYKLKRPCMGKGGEEKKIGMSSEDSIELLGDAVVVVTSGPTRGWDWTIKVLKRMYAFRDGMAISTWDQNARLFLLMMKLPSSKCR